MGEANLATHILGEAVSWCAAIAMIVLVIYLIKDIIGIMRGESAIGRLIVKILAVLALLGIMYAVKDFSTFGEIFSNLFSEIVTEDNLPDLAP